MLVVAPGSGALLLLMVSVEACLDAIEQYGPDPAHYDNGQATGSDGNVYIFPASANYIMKIDAISGNTSTVGPNLGGGWKYSSGQATADARHLYAAPAYSATEKMIKLDVEAQSVSLFDYPGSATGGSGWKYLGGFTSSTGLIYFFPFDANDVVKLDPATDTVTMLPLPASLHGGYLGGCGFGQKMYFFGRDNDRLVKLDATTEAFSQIATLPVTLAFGYQGATDPATGKIYLPPFNHDKVGILDSATDTISYMSESYGASELKWAGAVLRGQFVLASPRRHDKVLKIDVAAGTSAVLPESVTGSGDKYVGAAIAGNSIIYFTPRDANKMLKIECGVTQTPTLTKTSITLTTTATKSSQTTTTTTTSFTNSSTTATTTSTTATDTSTVTPTATESSTSTFSRTSTSNTWTSSTTTTHTASLTTSTWTSSLTLTSYSETVTLTSTSTTTSITTSTWTGSQTLTSYSATPTLTSTSTTTTTTTSARTSSLTLTSHSAAPTLTSTSTTTTITATSARTSSQALGITTSFMITSELHPRYTHNGGDTSTTPNASITLTTSSSFAMSSSIPMEFGTSMSHAASSIATNADIKTATLSVCAGPPGSAEQWCNTFPYSVCISVRECRWTGSASVACAGPGDNADGWCRHIPQHLCAKVKACRLADDQESKLPVKATVQAVSSVETSIRDELLRRAAAEGLLNASEPVIASQKTTLGVFTVASISPRAALAGGSGLTIAATGPDSSNATSVMLPASLLQRMFGANDGNGTVSVAMTIMSAAAQASFASSENESTKGPVLASPPVSINLYSDGSKKFKVHDLADPVQIVLQTAATEGARCAFWNEDISAWSNEGVVRVEDPSNPQALICNTTHLSIFGAVIGEFVSALTDTVSVLTCSNAEALLSARALAALFHDNGWQGRLPAVLLWLSLAINMLALGLARLADFQSQQKLPDHDEMLMAPNSSRATIAPAPVQDDPERSRTAKSLVCGYLGKCFRTVGLVLGWVGVLPNLLKTLLEGDASPGQLSQRFVEDRIKSLQARRAKVCRKTLNLAQAVADAKHISRHASFGRAVTKICEETDLKSRSEAATKTFLHASCLRRAVLLLPAIHPWAELSHFSAFTTYTARVAVLSLRLFVAMAVSVIFYDASGTTLSPDSDPKCKPKASIVAATVRAAAVGVISDIVASRAVNMLDALRKRQIAFRGEWNQRGKFWQQLAWQLKADLFWLLWVGCWMLCMTLIATFIASVDQASGATWLQSTGVSLLDEFILYPVVVALFFAILSSLLLRFRSGIKEQLSQSIDSGEVVAARDDDDPDDLPTLIAAERRPDNLNGKIAAGDAKIIVEELTSNDDNDEKEQPALGSSTGAGTSGRRTLSSVVPYSG